MVRWDATGTKHRNWGALFPEGFGLTQCTPQSPLEIPLVGTLVRASSFVGPGHRTIAVLMCIMCGSYPSFIAETHYSHETWQRCVAAHHAQFLERHLPSTISDVVPFLTCMVPQ